MDDEVSTNDARVSDLVRLALASEYNKKGLKREEIIEKVCGTLRKGVLFDKVFKLANESLNENFGCLLVPLPIVAKPVIVSASTNKSRKAAVIQSNKAANSKSSAAQSFALISTLSINEKSLIPQNVRDTQRLAVIQAILIIIKLSGNMIEHRHLLAALNDIKLAHNDTGPLPFKDLDSFLELMKREKYILRGKKNLLETESIYSWGPRAYVEFQPKRMAIFLFKMACTNSKEDEIEPKFLEKAERVLGHCEQNNVEE